MLGSQGIVVKCTAAIFFPTVDFIKGKALGTRLYFGFGFTTVQETLDWLSRLIGK